MKYYLFRGNVYKQERGKLYQIFTLYVFGCLHGTWMLCNRPEPELFLYVVFLEDLLAMPDLPDHTIKLLVQEI